MRRFLSLVLAAGAAVLCAAPAWADGMSQTEITADFGPSAPYEAVESLQRRLSDDPSPLYRALAGDLKGRNFAIDIENTRRGVDLELHIEGSASEAKHAAEAVAIPLQDVAQEVGGDYAVEVVVRSPGWSWPALPRLSLPRISSPIPGRALPGVLLGLLLAALGVGLAGFIFQRSRTAGQQGKRLPMPSVWGAPVLGMLPESLARVGKLYHLQSKPCQAFGYFFLQQARDARDIVIAGETPEGAGTVAVCLALYLVREGEKILLVDMTGESQVVPGILARFGPAPESGEGAHGTSIPDLDLMTLPELAGDLPSLPPDLKQNYVRILYVPAPGMRPKGGTVVDVIARPSFSQALSGSRRLGWVYFGDGAPLRLSDRYYTRYYYEKLHDVSEPVGV